MFVKVCFSVSELEGGNQVSISPTFYSRFCAAILLTKKIPSQTVSREKLCKTLLCKKFARKMLVKLKPRGKNCSPLLEKLPHTRTKMPNDAGLKQIQLSNFLIVIYILIIEEISTDLLSQFF
jgi:hypothetical protein